MRRSLRVTAVVVAASVILMGCWQQPGGGPDRRGHNVYEVSITTDSVGDLEHQWTADLGPIESEPVLSAGSLFVRTSDTLYRIDRATGDVVWATGPPGSHTHFHGPVIVDGDRVVTASGGSSLHRPTSRRFDVETGQPDEGGSWGYVSSLRRPYAASQYVMSDPRVGTYAFLRIRNLEEGTYWETIVDTRLPEVTVGDELAFNMGYGVNSTEPTDDTADLGVGIRAYPLAEEPDDCFSVALACPTWVLPLDETADLSAPVLSRDGETVYAVAGGAVYALAADSGEVLWTGTGVVDESRSPALADGHLYVTNSLGFTSMYDADGCGEPTCDPVHSFTTGREQDEIPVRPIVAGRGDEAVLFTVSSQGYVDAYPAAGCGGSEPCTPVWSGETGGAITTPPVVAYGRLYVGTESGLVSFGLP